MCVCWCIWGFYLCKVLWIWNLKAEIQVLTLLGKTLHPDLLLLLFSWSCQNIWGLATLSIVDTVEANKHPQIQHTKGSSIKCCSSVFIIENVNSVLDFSALKENTPYFFLEINSHKIKSFTHQIILWINSVVTWRYFVCLGRTMMWLGNTRLWKLNGKMEFTRNLFSHHKEI